MSDLLNQYRRASPELADLTDDDLIKAIHAASGDQGSPYDYARSVLGYKDQGSRMKDFGIDVARSVGALGEIATGAIDLATGGRGSQAWRDAGRQDPVQEYKETLARGYSTKRKEAEYNTQVADGFWNKLQAHAQNPSVAIGALVEQGPSLVIPFGAAAKGAKIATNIARAAGPATPKALRFADEAGRVAGETAAWTGITAGQTAAVMQQRAPGDTDAMYEAAGLSSLGTAGITAGFSFLPGGAMAKQATGLMGRYAAGTANQAAQIGGEAAIQNTAQNYALERPLDEGLADAVAMGLVAAPAFGALAARKRPDYEPPAAPAVGSRAPVTTEELQRTWHRPAVKVEGDTTLSVTPQGDVLTPDQIAAYEQFRNTEHPDLATQPQQAPAGQVEDPAARALSDAEQSGKAAAVEKDPPPTPEELSALFEKIGEPTFVDARRADGTVVMNDDGKPLKVRHWDGSDKKGPGAAYTSPEKMKSAIERAIKAEREKPAGIRAAEASIAKAVKGALGRLPTSKELNSIVKETQLDGLGEPGQEFSPTRLLYQIEGAINNLEGKKSPDAQFKRDVLDAWKKELEKDLKAEEKPKATGPQRAPAPKTEVAVQPPAEVLAAIADRSPTITVKDGNGKVATLDRAAVIERIKKLSPQQRQAMNMLLGVDEAGDAVGTPMPHAQVAKAVGVSKAAVTSWATKLGLTEDAISRFASVDLPTATKADEVQFMDNPETGEGSGFTVREDAGDLNKGGLVDTSRTAAQRRADAVADEFLAKNASVETPDVQTPKDIETEAAIDQKRRLQAEITRMEGQKRAMETPYREEAIREYNALRSKKLGEKRFEELDETLQTDWVLLYDFNERSDLAGRGDDVQDLFDDFKRENYDRLVRTGEPSADRASTPNLGRSGDEGDVQPRAGEDGDAGAAQAGAPEVADGAPRVVTKRRRVAVKPDDAQYSTGYKNSPDGLMGFRKGKPNRGFHEENYKHVQYVEVEFDGGYKIVDAIKGLNPTHAMERARRNWPTGKVRGLSEADARALDPTIVEDVSQALQRVESGASYRTAFELEKELKLFMNASTLGKMVQITDSKGVDAIQGQGWAQQFPYVMGFATTEGKVVLIADRIPRGEGKGVFLHELGSHLGIDRMLPAQQRGEVARQIANWARTDKGDTGKVASAAMARTANAETNSTIQRQETEVIAYFIEEALAHGVKPSIHGSGAARLLHKIKELFQNALRKIFGGRVGELTMQDLVDLAYGAAQRNISDKPIRQELSHLDGVFDTTFGPRNVALDQRDRLKKHASDIDYNLNMIKGVEEHFPEEFNGLLQERDSVAEKIAKIDRLYKPWNVGTVQFSQQRTIERNINRMPRQLRKPARGITAAVHDVTARGAMASSFMHDFADWAGKHNLPAVKTIADFMSKRGALKVQLDQDLGKIVRELQTMKDDVRLKVLTYLQDATMSQRWGYQPTWRPEVDVDPAAAAKWDALSAAEQKMADTMLRHNYEVWTAKQDAIRDMAHAHYTEMIADAEARGADRAEIDKLWAEMDRMVEKTSGLLDGPYVSLKQYGTHVVTLRSQEFIDAVEAGDRSAIGKMQDDPDHYQVVFVDGAGRAANKADELGAQYPEMQVEYSRREEHEYLGAGYETLEKLANAVKSRISEYGDHDREVAAQTYRALQEAIIESLGEFNARSSAIQRKFVAGMEPEGIARAFASQGYADNRFISNSKFNKEINDAMGQLRQQVRRGGDRTMKQHFYNELQKRRSNALRVQMPAWAGHAMRFTTLWKLVTSPAYYLQYLTQPITMFLPAIQGKHGYAAGVKAFIEGVKTVTQMHKGLDEMDFSKVDDADERRMLQEMRDNGSISIGHEQMFGRLEMIPDGAFSEAWQKVSDHVARIPHSVEAFNRAASALAAYRMERKNGASHEDASKYVRDVVLQTYGDYSSFNAPRVFQGSAITRMAMQYRQFQFIHSALLVRLINAAFKGADHETRKIARLQLGYMAGHYGVLAGALGVPAAHLVGHALRLTLGDETDKDLETFVKRHVNDKTAQDLILGGIPRAAFGQDLATRVGAGDIADPMRYGSVGGALSGKEGYKDFLTAAAGPFFGGMIPQVIDGVNTIGDGDIYRGLEKLTPKGIADVMRAVRIADEGLVDNKGAQVEDEIGTGDILAKALGSNPVSITGPSHDSYVANQIIRGFKDEANTLKTQFIRAQREGEDVEEIVEDFKNLMARQKAAGIKPMTLSDLYKAPRNMRAREMRTVNGVQFRPGTEELVRDITGEGTDEAEE